MAHLDGRMTCLGRMDPALFPPPSLEDLWESPLLHGPGFLPHETV